MKIRTFVIPLVCITLPMHSNAQTPTTSADSQPTAEQALLSKAWSGDTTAQFQVGVALMQAKDYKASLEYLNKAALKNHSGAQGMIGSFYAQGLGVPQNLQEAFRWYKKSADQGDAIGQRCVGDMYMSGWGTVKPNPQEAVQWYKKSADKGDPYGQYELGYAYASGQGVPKNPQEAIRLFIKAAEQGHPQAESKLGFLYLKGLMVEQDTAKGVALLRKAAVQGDQEAKEELKKAGISEQ